jgi:hypothetical protein
MAPDDRDSIFEKALAQHLRPKASPLGAGGTPSHADPQALEPPCLDSETLAAYYERLLAPDQMIACQQHIAGCPRCRPILAALEATDDLLLETDQQIPETKNVVTMHGSDIELPGELLTETSKGVAALPSRAARLAHSAWRSKTLHGANWRWLAPAGAIAAGLLLWISFHERRTPAIEIAKNTQPLREIPPSATPSAAPAQSAAPEEKEFAHDQASRSPALRRDARTEADALNKQATTKNERAMLDQKKPYDQAAGNPESSPSDATSPLSATQPKRDASPSALTDELELRQRNIAKEALPSAPAPGPPAAKSTPPVDQRSDNSPNAVAGEVPASPARPSFKAKAAAGRQTQQELDKQQPVGAVAQAQSASVVRAAGDRSGVIVTAPGFAVLWSLFPAGVIKRSVDNGATWTVQASGVVSDLLAGSAPSADICWVVGRDGTIVRTTDGGGHWQKLPPPVTEDLSSVFAVSPQQVTVTSASTHKTYRTTNAGQTWTLIPNP